MCVYCVLKRLFCISDGTKTWGHGHEQAILSRQFLGYFYGWGEIPGSRTKLRYIGRF